MTLAGSSTTNGWVDGPGASARFYGIQGIAIGPAGSIFVLDQPANFNGSTAYSKWAAIRQIGADGTVTTVVVSSAAQPYYAIPAGNHVVISQPLQAIGSTPNGTLLVASGCAAGQIALP